MARSAKAVRTAAEKSRAKLVAELTRNLSPTGKRVWKDLEETDCDLSLLAKMLVCDLIEMAEAYAGVQGADPIRYYSSRREHIELLRKVTQTAWETSRSGPSEMTINVVGLTTPLGPYDDQGRPIVSAETTTTEDQP